MTNKQLLQALTKAFLAPNIFTTYSGRWDVWLVQNGHIEEFKHLMLKTDDQLNRLLLEAQDTARQIKNSPLTKALSFKL